MAHIHVVAWNTICVCYSTESLSHARKLSLYMYVCEMVCVVNIVRLLK